MLVLVERRLRVNGRMSFGGDVPTLEASVWLNGRLRAGLPSVSVDSSDRRRAKGGDGAFGEKKPAFFTGAGDS